MRYVQERAPTRRLHADSRSAFAVSMCVVAAGALGVRRDASWPTGGGDPQAAAHDHAETPLAARCDSRGHRHGCRDYSAQRTRCLSNTPLRGERSCVGSPSIGWTVNGSLRELRCSFPLSARHYGAMAGGTAGEGAVPSRLSAITLAGHPFECSGQPPAETY